MRYQNSLRIIGSVVILIHTTIATSAVNNLGESNAVKESLGKLKSLSLEELLDMQVVTVSRSPSKLSQAPAAIQVISSEDIRRSGATSLPEALRLASNLEVARVNSRDWAISSRGFNNTLANKLLVMIDGRTIYTPLYAGVYWDAQHVLLEDISQIEVVSGPGGTLWGANAVNGVINIITKSARDTQGLYVSGGAAPFWRILRLRYGDRFVYLFFASMPSVLIVVIPPGEWQ